MRRRLLLPVLLACGCAAGAQNQAAQTEVEAKTAVVEPPPPPPPELELEVLAEKEAVGLAIHNRGEQDACIVTTLKLTPASGQKAAEVEMTGFGNGEVVLTPGTEFYWPSDWGIGDTAPPQSTTELSGTYRFHVQGCEGTYTFDSSSFDLAPGQPVQKHAGASTMTARKPASQPAPMEAKTAGAEVTQVSP